MIWVRQTDRQTAGDPAAGSTSSATVCPVDARTSPPCPNYDRATSGHAGHVMFRTPVGRSVGRAAVISRARYKSPTYVHRWPFRLPQTDDLPPRHRLDASSRVSYRRSRLVPGVYPLPPRCLLTRFMTWPTGDVVVASRAISAPAACILRHAVKWPHENYE